MRAQQCAEASDRTKRQALSESDSAHRRNPRRGKKDDEQIGKGQEETYENVFAAGFAHEKIESNGRESKEGSELDALEISIHSASVQRIGNGYVAQAK